MTRPRAHWTAPSAPSVPSLVAGACAALLLALAPAPARAQDAPAGPQPFPLDDARMADFAYWIGTWGAHPDSAGAEAYREVYEWAIPGKAVRKQEYRRIDGRLQPISEALIGYHYGLREIHYVDFVMDRPQAYEVAYFGTYRFEDADVAPRMIRMNRAYDPDTSNRLYRETYTALDPNTRRLDIEVLTDAGEWRSFGSFVAVRRDPVPPGG